MVLGQQSAAFQPLNMQQCVEVCSNVSFNGYNSPFSAGAASLFLDIKANRKEKVCLGKVCGKCFEQIVTEEGCFCRGQAAMASPVSCKLSPVENSVAPGNRKKTQASSLKLTGEEQHASWHIFKISVISVKYYFRW